MYIWPLVFYNPRAEEYDCIQNPFANDAETFLQIRENSLEVRKDRTPRLKFSKVAFDVLWISTKDKCKQVWNAAVETLLKYFSRYLCEQTFHLWYCIKQILCLKEIDGELQVALSNFEPNVQRLCPLKQAQNCIGSSCLFQMYRRDLKNISVLHVKKDRGALPCAYTQIPRMRVACTASARCCALTRWKSGVKPVSSETNSLLLLLWSDRFPFKAKRLWVLGVKVCKQRVCADAESLLQAVCWKTNYLASLVTDCFLCTVSFRAGVLKLGYAYPQYPQGYAREISGVREQLHFSGTMTIFRVFCLFNCVHFMLHYF